jgi:hypothetical protein
MAYSKVRWISTPAFLACVGGAHGRGEGANVREGAYASLRQPYAPPQSSVFAPLPTYAPLSQPYAPATTPTIQRGSDVAAMWQQRGSHRGQSKSRFTLSKVNKTLTLIGRTQTLLEVIDGRTDGRIDNPVL